MIYHAVIDTNVLISSLLSRSDESSTVLVLECIMNDIIIPLYNEEILSEYKGVLAREKFGFNVEVQKEIIQLIVDKGIALASTATDPYLTFPDLKDIVFYEVSLSKEDSFLVTGNKKHFPAMPKVVSPTEMIQIIRAGRGPGRILSDGD